MMKKGMIKVSVLYPNGNDKIFDMDYYCNTHAPLVAGLLGDALQWTTVEKGLGGAVQFIADTLNISPNYLSDVLKVLTGQSTQQHILGKLIEKAKEKLSSTDLSISEFAYELGFEYPQSFAKLFKAKTNLSPLQFRN